MRTSHRVRAVIGWLIAAIILAVLGIPLWPIISANPVPDVQREVSGPASWYARQFRLDDGEMVRFIPPPFLPERRRVYLRQLANSASASPRENGQLTFYFSPAGLRRWSMTRAPGTFASAIIDCGIVTQAQVNIPADLKYMPVDGDWIIRGNADSDERLAALAPILGTLLKRDIQIKKHNLDTNVIVARGRWSEHPAPTPSNPNIIQLFVDTLDTTQTSSGGMGRFREFLRHLEDVTRMQIDDQIEDPPRLVAWRSHLSIMRGVSSDPQKLTRFLDNLTQQTSITFTVEKHQATMFEVSEARH
jgi:hypothetical protein